MCRCTLRSCASSWCTESCACSSTAASAAEAARCPTWLPSSSVRPHAAVSLPSRQFCGHMPGGRGPPHPHEARRLALLVHRHVGAVGHVVQAVVSRVVQRLADLVLPGVVRDRGARLHALGRLCNIGPRQEPAFPRGGPRTALAHRSGYSTGVSSCSASFAAPAIAAEPSSVARLTPRNRGVTWLPYPSPPFPTQWHHCLVLCCTHLRPTLG